MKTIYVVALYSGIECHVEFQANVAAFETREKADAFIIEEEARLKEQLVMQDHHDIQWEKVNKARHIISMVLER